MTANQVAFAVTNEQNRHNLKSEELQKYSLDIENSKVQFQRDYQQRDLFLKEQYNNAYLDYLRADQSEKARYQKAMNDIAEQQTANNAYYQSLNVALEKQKAKAQADYWEKSAETAKRNADIYNKKVEYDNAFNQVTASNWLTQNQINIQRVNNDFTLGMYDQWNRLMSNQISLMDTKQKARYYNSKALESISEAIRNTIGAAGAVSGTLLQLGGL